MKNKTVSQLPIKLSWSKQTKQAFSGKLKIQTLILSLKAKAPNYGGFLFMPDEAYFPP